MSSQTRDIHIQRFDLEGARSWMSGICGPHRLVTATPERLRFHHSANVFKSRATTLVVIEYGTDVTDGAPAAWWRMARYFIAELECSQTPQRKRSRSL